MKLSKYGFNVALVLLLVPGIARADNPDLMTLIGASSAGSNYAAINNSGGDMNGNASTYNLSASDHNSFAVDYGSGGVIRGHGRCSTRAGTNPWSNDTYDIISSNFVDSLTDETGQTGAQYCYCGLDSYTASGGSAQSLSGPWVFDYDSDVCAGACADACAYHLMVIGSDVLAFRAAVFNAYAPSSSASGDAITTQTYVDNALNGKQAKITTTGTNKLMTFGNGAGAAPGSRDIVTALGTSTTATTVPETGPIVAGINSKQDAVNGTANYVMTGTGTAGTVGEKPVYSATTNYTNALVTAQTINTAAATAANSELMCHSYVENASQTPENCLLWEVNSVGMTLLNTQGRFISFADLDPSINGTGGCAKEPSWMSKQQRQCSDATYNSLQYGEWGAVFPYGEVTGYAVCSRVAPDSTTRGSIPNDTKQVSIQQAYDTWVENGRGSYVRAEKYCYIKLKNPSSPDSRWVLASSYDSGDTCQNCPIYGGSNSVYSIDRNAAVRAAVFSTGQ